VGLSIGGKIIAENNYNQLQFSNNQADFDRKYKIANFAQRGALVAGGIGLVINIADAVIVFKRGSMNDRSPLKFTPNKYTIK
jgi:hypothetical protein